jgi:FAD synthetase
MSLETLTSKYIVFAEVVFKNLQKSAVPIGVTEEGVNNLLSYAYDYLEDAKYYKASGKLETSLTSIAYCEGVLDALRLLGAVTFEWPTIKKSEIEE